MRQVGAASTSVGSELGCKLLIFWRWTQKQRHVQVVLVHAMKTYGGVEVELHSFLTSLTMRAVNVRLRPLYPLRMNPGTHGIEGWVDPRASLDEVEKKKYCATAGIRTARSYSCTDCIIPVRNNSVFNLFWAVYYQCLNPCNRNSTFYLLLAGLKIADNLPPPPASEFGNIQRWLQ
jgi:hypothetical protein